MRGLASVDVNCPNVTLFVKSRLPRPFPPPACNEPTSKRGVFVRLNVSQRNFTSWDSEIFQVLPTPRSIPKYPGPRNVFLCPDWPAYAKPKSWVAAVGSLNRFGIPFTMNAPVGPVGRV